VSAADLYRSQLLPDDRYVEWLEEPRKRLQRLYVKVLQTGRLWERLIAVDPTDEQAQCALMQDALDLGNRGAAIRLFQKLRERLRLDLGIGPSKAAFALYQRALETPALDEISVGDRVRASLAWGLVHLHGGEPQRAEQVARENREIAAAAGLGRELGEATALLGLVAHMQGRWSQLFRGELSEWLRGDPAATSTVLDGHTCFAQFSIARPAGHGQMGVLARELLTMSEDAGSTQGRALATLLLGELPLCAGRLDEAEELLRDSERWHRETGGVTGRTLALEQLALLAIAQQQVTHARALTEQAAALATSSWLSPHLSIRTQALRVQLGASTDAVLQAISEGDRLLLASCQPCSMSFRTAAAIALAGAGELDQVSRRLDEAERLASMWSGGPWVASILEARGVFRHAQGHTDRANAGFSEAAARYAELGRPLDHARCLRRLCA